MKTKAHKLYILLHYLTFLQTHLPMKVVDIIHKLNDST